LGSRGGRAGGAQPRRMAARTVGALRLLAVRPRRRFVRETRAQTVRPR
jgi:hypothetical protein